MQRQPVVNIETGNKKRILKMKGKEREPVTNEANDDRSMSSGVREKTGQLSGTDGDYHTDRYRKNAGDFRMKFRPPIFRRGCSKHCTGIKRDESDTSSVRIDKGESSGARDKEEQEDVGAILEPSESEDKTICNLWKTI
ncbi:hypothetical protein K0M31_003996 [Melipona bicolor]|uniref:Uncharacterized protein n=1 Tax=Melipona bicolor TaxID=60889 RepID=A0AA40FYC5_9HYME|nr:hypothetical protein K0M31_003996 [Melipona bicolor]